MTDRRPRTYRDQVAERGPIDEYRVVRVETRDRVAVITLHDPDSLNAYSIRMTGELRHALATASRNEQIRVVILTGAGRAFSAGGDLRQMEAAETGPIETFEFIRREFGGIVESIVHMDKPVVAAVNGHAMGVGFFTALACDMIVASEAARFGTAYVQLALTPLGVSYLLATLIGYQRAFALCALGDVVDARRGVELGFVHRAVAAEHLMDEAMALARRLADGPPRALGLAKQLLRRAVRAGLEEHMLLGDSLQPLCLASDDHREALDAFRSGRRPEFAGR